MQLKSFSNGNFERGASGFKEALWLALSGILVESWLPGSSWRCWLLRSFGASVGRRVVIKPRVRVKFPWRLSIEDDVWIGESVWIDNLDFVTIGHDTCLSQGVFLCTGSHDWKSSTFDLVTRPIFIASHVWVGAMARVAPGAILGEGAVVAMGASVKGELMPYMIFGDSSLVTSSNKRRYTSK